MGPEENPEAAHFSFNHMYCDLDQSIINLWANVTNADNVGCLPVAVHGMRAGLREDLLSISH